MRKISLIVLNWNGWEDTFSCLNSIVKAEISSFTMEIILIDNASNNLPLTRISRYKKLAQNNGVNLIFIQNSVNYGFAEGNNIGIKKALVNNADYIMLLNNDVIIDKFLLKNLFIAAEKEKSSSIIAPKIYFAKGFEYHKKRYQENDLGRVIWYAGGIIDWKNIYWFHRGVDEVDGGQYEKSEATDFASGCCMFIPRRIVEKIGFFDRRYFLYFEDVDYCLCAKQRGFKILYAAQAVLWHKNAQSSGNVGSSLQEYYQTRNRLLFGFKYGKLRVKAALLKETAGFLGKSKVKRKAIFDFFSGNFGEVKT